MTKHRLTENASWCPWSAAEDAALLPNTLCEQTQLTSPALPPVTAQWPFPAPHFPWSLNYLQLQKAFCRAVPINPSVQKSFPNLSGT